MTKWYEVPEYVDSSVIYSKVRLVRNWAEYPFPGKMAKEQSLELTARILGGVQELNDRDHNKYLYSYLHQMSDLEKAVLIFEKKGYQSDPKTSHDISIHSAGGVHLELHYETVETGRAANRSYALYRRSHSIPRASFFQTVP